MVPDRQKVRTDGMDGQTEWTDRMDGRTEWTDDTKTISLRLRRGIKNGVQSVA